MKDGFQVLKKILEFNAHLKPYVVAGFIYY